MYFLVVALPFSGLDVFVLMETLRSANSADYRVGEK
jgi:hypothetical protein